MVKRNSFTILELLVSMAILGVVVSTLYVSFRGGTSSWTAGDARSQRCQNARGVLEIMSRDLKQAFTKSGSTTLGLQGIEDTWTDTEVSPSVDRANDRVYFTSASNYPNTSGEYDLCEVGYYLLGSARILYRIEDDSIDSTLGTDGDPAQLGLHVIGLDLRYYNTGTSSWSSNGTYTKSATLPGAVEITITVEDEDRIESPKDFKTIVYIP